MKTNAIIALDVGGTFIKSCLVIEGVPLPSSYAEHSSRAEEDAQTILDQFMNIIQDQYKHYYREQNNNIPVHWSIGIAFPGPFDYELGICYIRGLSKFEALYNTNIREAFYHCMAERSNDAWARELSHAEIRFENDAKLFALGVSTLFPKERFISLTLGTGLGSAFISQGVIMNEGPGVPLNGWLYDKPYRNGIIDDAFSRRGILQLASEYHALQEGMDVKELAEAARQGDALMTQVFTEFGHRLAQMLLPYVASYQPHRIVLGGQIAKCHDLFIPALLDGLDAYNMTIYTSEHVLEYTFIGISKLFVGA